MRAISIISAAVMLASSVSASNDPRECEGERGEIFSDSNDISSTKNAVPCLSFLALTLNY
jgi:hypothetical protein